MTQLDFFDKINTQLAKELPLVVYRKPKENKVNTIFQEDDSLHVLDSYAEVGFIFSPFESENASLLLKMHESFELPNFSEEKFEAGIDHLFEESHGKKSLHKDLVKKGIAEINAGNFDKIVLSRCFDVNIKTSPVVLFQRLLLNYRNAFCYLWYHPKVGMWLGATPEILLMVRGQNLTTMSLAGTQLYDGEDNPDWGNKELEEQELVTDYILDALGDKVKNLSSKNVESVRAGNLMHLRTKISGIIERDNLRAILEALHPTPAVCGLPKQATKEFILQHENYDREFYTGYLGELNIKLKKQRSSRRANQENQAYKTLVSTTTLFVNLRCMKLKKEKALIYVGGGITKDSNPDKEWKETVSKSKTILHVL